MVKKQITMQDVQQILEGWKNDDAVKSAEDMLNKYGIPDEATHMRLIWHNNDPWASTMVVDEAITHNFPTPHNDHLYQYINYTVPEEKACDLLEFNESILIDVLNGKFGSRCEKEFKNILTLNIGMDIINGKMTVDQARMFMVETVIEKKHPEYIEELRFVPATPAEAM